MGAALRRAREEVALGNRILANEGVLDAFGHVSLRNPENPNHYLLSRSRAPELVDTSDVLEYDMDSNPVHTTNYRLYAERVIHGEIYKARPDVQAIVHHHAPAIMPFCIAGIELVPVFHLGATIGRKVPFWDQHDEFGNTNLLVVKPEEGASLARALGPHPMVLMNRHGATAVGANVQELVFRAIYSCRNAEFQYQARALGRVIPLWPGEIDEASKIDSLPTATNRTWEYWFMRLQKSGNWLRAGAAGPGGKRASVKRSGRKKSRGRKR